LLGPESLAAPYQSTTNSINTNPITGANLIGTDNTEYGIVTDNTAIMLAAKYTWDPFKFYAGYEHIQQFNPSNPLGIGASAQGGYLLSGVEDNNLDSPKIVQVAWTGVKYAYDIKTDITLSAYHQWQNDFRVPSACPPTSFRASCSGFLNEFRCMRIITSPSVSTFMPDCVFRRERRSGHRHSSRPRRPLSAQQQHCSDDWCSFHVLIVFRGGLEARR
jgi:hypothetical protein